MTKKQTEPYQFSRNWFTIPSEYSDRITTKQWQNILLEKQDKFFANGELYKLNAKRVGPGVYEIRAKKE